MRASLTMNKSDDLSWLFQGLRGIKTLNAIEEREFLHRIRKGDDDAKQQFVWHNLPLVIKVAGDMTRNHHAVMTDTADLFRQALNEGVLGLYRAVDEFDLGYDVRFSTLAVLYIKEFIRRVLTFDVSSVKPIKSLDKAKSTKQFIAMIGSLPNFDHKAPDTEHPVDAMDTAKVLGELGKALGNLSEEERYIVENRYGFYGKQFTYSELAKLLGISMERVRQIENRALRRLFMVLNKNKIQDYTARRKADAALCATYQEERNAEQQKKERAMQDALFEMFESRSFESLQGGYQEDEDDDDSSFGFL